MYPIPANATRIRYLESNGTQYVDTEVVPNGATGIDCDFALLNPTQNFSPVFWSRGSSATDRAYCFEGERISGYAKWQARWDYGSYGPQQVRNVIEQGARTTASVRSGTLTVDATTLARNEQTFTGAGSIILFNFCNYVDGQRQMISAAVQPIRIYSCAIYDGSTLVRDFVPLRIGQVGYLFDRVSGQLFGNAGTGSFVLGPDTFSQGVVPTRMMAMGVRKKPYDAEVEYLESDGTPYINTGYLLTDNTEIEVRAALTQPVQNAPAFFGSRSVSGGTNGVVSWWDSDEFWCYAPGISSSSATKVSMSFPAGTQFIFRYAGDGIYVNGIKKTTYRTKTPLTDQLPLWIFAINNGGAHYNPRVPCRIYNFRIWDSGTLVHDYIPVRIGSGSSAVGYLFDRVSGELFGNAGTGAFTIGPDKT